jgi:hypothetical protein
MDPKDEIQGHSNGKQHHTTITSGATGASAGAARAVEPIGESPRPSDVASETKASGSAPEREQIARLAYSYWQARGCPEGSPEEAWFRAEAELGRPTAGMGAWDLRRWPGPVHDWLSPIGLRSLGSGGELLYPVLVGARRVREVRTAASHPAHAYQEAWLVLRSLLSDVFTCQETVRQGRLERD